MKQIAIKAIGVTAKVENIKEEVLANHVNGMIETMVKFLSDGTYEEMGLNFSISTWTVIETAGKLNAMWYMDMIDKPVSNIDLAKAIKAEAEKAA